MTYLDHKDGEPKLTTVERALQTEQEANFRTCETCRYADIHRRSGFIGCMESRAPGTKDVMAKLIRCEYYV